MLSVQGKTAPLVYSLLVGVRPPGQRHAHLLSLPPISPAARRTVSSTIKGCAVMKGALAEAIYFPVQCRKVSPVLIFQHSLCVPYSAIMAGVTGRDEEDAPWLNKWSKGGERRGGGIKAKHHHIFFKINSHLSVFLQCACLCFSSSLVNSHHSASAFCALAPFFPR